MRFATIIFLCFVLCGCFILCGCFGIGVDVRETKHSWMDAFTSESGSNALLYTLSIVAIAASIAMIIWTPLKQAGLFGVTMFSSIIILTYVFAFILSIMPWLLGGALLLVAAYIVLDLYKHNWSVSGTIKDAETKVEDVAGSEFSKLLKK